MRAQALPDAVFDPSRLAAVRVSGLVDTGAEEPFDRLTRLAALVIDVPLAFVTVVDERRSWYKSCIGLPDGAERSGPVEESFCQYVVGTDAALLVDDARTDPRTWENPAIDIMGVAAWAGFPVRAPSGEVLGTFCVVDTSPHAWTERDAQVLETLAGAATGEIALRSALAGERSARSDAEAAADEAEVAADASAGLAAGRRHGRDRLSPWHAARPVRRTGPGRHHARARAWRHHRLLQRRRH